MNKKLFYFLPLVFIFLSSLKTFSQEDILDFFKKVKISAGVDLYYAYDTDKDKALMLSSISPHRDEFGLNLANIKFSYNEEPIRGVLAFHYGDIVKENWESNHPNIQQANIGIKPFENLWIDAGYFITYIGEESFPNESSFTSFALPSQYQPFYYSGIKISYDYNENFGAALHIMNGYNIIEDNNKNKTIGLQLYYKPKDYLEFLYNNMIGNEMPSDASGKMRMINDFIISYGPYKNFEASFLFDIILQENSKISDSTSFAYAYGSLVILKYHFTPKFSAMIRGEYYQDLDGILSGIIKNNMGMKGNGITIGCEYRPLEKTYFRLESRYLRLDDNLRIFYNEENRRLEFIISAGIEY